MKTRSIIIFMLLFSTASASFAQSDWFDKFSDNKDITQVTITKTLLNMIPGVTGTMNMNGINVKDIMTKLDQIDIFTSDKKATMGMMRKEMSAFFKSNKSYEILMKVKDESDHVTFYGQKDGEIIKSLVMLAEGDEEYVIIRLMGKFTAQDIQNITKSERKK